MAGKLGGFGTGAFVQAQARCKNCGLLGKQQHQEHVAKGCSKKPVQPVLVDDEDEWKYSEPDGDNNEL